MAKAIVIPSLINTLPFDQVLSWEEFQLFTTDLLYQTVDSIQSREYLLKGSNQQGIDVYSVPRGGIKVTVAQCKLKKYIGPKEVLQIVNDFLEGHLVEQTSEFILCTNVDLGRERDEEMIARAREKLKEYEIDFLVWDHRGLSEKLRAYNPAVISIVCRYFGEEVAAAFYGSFWQQYINQHKKVEKHTYPLPQDHMERSIVSYQERINNSEKDKWQFWSSQKKPTLASLVEEGIRKGGKKILLLSTAGFGKTEDLKFLAGYFSADDKLLYPIKFILRDYDGQSIEDILAAYDVNWRNISDENLLFVLDGLDEISEHYFQSFINRLNAFIELHPACSAVVSSRYNFYNVRSNDLRGFEIFLLNSLTRQDIEEYLEQKLKQDKAIFKQLLEERYFNDYINNPYYLTRLVRFYKEDQKQFPKNKSELFDKILFEKIEKDADRYHVTQLKVQLLPVAQQIAFCMTLAGKSSLTDDELSTLISDQDLRKKLNHFSVFNRNLEQLSSWSFEHKNLQEYLCASVFITREFAEVQSIVAFNQDNNKLLPRFLNTISFLFELLDKDSALFIDLFSWINTNEPELLIRFEKEQLSKPTRRTIFEKIFSAYKEKGITLRISPQLSNNELATFVGVDEWLIDYLGKELNADLPMGLAFDALEIIAAHPKPFLAEKEIQSILFAVLSGNYYKSFVKGQAIEVFADAGLVSSQVFDQILKLGVDVQDFEIRRACIHFLSKVDYAENYVDFILQSISIFEAGQKDMSFGGANDSIKHLLLGFSKPISLKKIFQYCITDKDTISHYNHYRKFHFELNEVTTVLKKAIEVYKLDKSILPVIYRLYCRLEYIAVWDHWFDVFKNFFIQTCGVKTIFSKFYRYGRKNRELMSFADEGNCDFLIEEYQKGNIDDKQMTIYQNQLSWVNFAMFRQLNEKLNKVTGNKFIYPDLNINYNEIDRLQLEKNQKMMLNKELFLEEANKIFDLISKEKINYTELWELSNKGLRIFRESIVLYAIRDQCRHEQERLISRKAFLKNFESETRWDDFIVSTVENMLREKEPKPILPEVRQMVEDWCVHKIETLNFEGAVRDKQETGSFTMNGHKNYVKNLFLLLNIQIDDKLLLKMLPLDYDTFFGDKESIGKLAIEKVTDLDLLKSTVINNIKSETLAAPVLGSHFKICHQLNFRDCLPWLYKTILDNKHFNDYDRKKLTDYYLDLGGEISDFEKFLTVPEEGDKSLYATWHWFLIEKFLEWAPDKIVGILLNILSDPNQSANKLRASEYLIQLSRIEGLIYWANRLKGDGQISLDRHWINLQEGIANMPTSETINLFFSVLEHYYENNSATRSRSREVDDLVFTSLISIAKKDHANYLVIKNRITRMIEKTSGKSYADSLVVFSERLTQNYFESQSQEMDIASANLIYRQFVFS